MSIKTLLPMQYLVSIWLVLVDLVVLLRNIQAMAPKIVRMDHTLIERSMHLLSCTHLHLIHILITIHIISHVIYRGCADCWPLIHIHLGSLIMHLSISIWFHVQLGPLTAVFISKFYIVLPTPPINFLIIIEFQRIPPIVLLIIFAPA